MNTFLKVSGSCNYAYLVSGKSNHLPKWNNCLQGISSLISPPLPLLPLQWYCLCNLHIPECFYCPVKLRHHLIRKSHLIPWQSSQWNEAEAFCACASFLPCGKLSKTKCTSKVRKNPNKPTLNNLPSLNLILFSDSLYQQRQKLSLTRFFINQWPFMSWKHDKLNILACGCQGGSLIQLVWKE